MQIDAVDEYNENGHLIYSANFIGAFVRGKTREKAVGKFPAEIAQYCRWLGMDAQGDCRVVIVQQKQSGLQICDADSEVLFDTERAPLTPQQYIALRDLALKSARDFETLYSSVPVKDKAAAPARNTFYGPVPATADEMYLHTKNVNDYYFAQIGIPAENDPDIYTCRLRAFEQVEKQPDFLENRVFDGSYAEQWSLRKVCRRFVWHDRIHAKAMYRAAVKLGGGESTANPFCFVI